MITYPNRPIRSVESLARSLGCCVADLLALATAAPYSYRIAGRKVKENGEVRITFDAYPRLKSLHRRIQDVLLSQIVLPPYLHGGVKRRDQKTNAEVHLGARTLIKLDIASFFSNSAAIHIRNIFEELMRFSGPVSEVLTEITTRYGFLPQGAVTSPALANLLFWRHEHRLVRKLANRQIAYSRFVDDITLSSETYLDDTSVARCISCVKGLLKSYGLRAKNAKTEVVRAGGRMAVTGLTITKSGLALPRRKRARIRAAVDRFVRCNSQILENSLLDAVPNKPKPDSLDRLTGRINHLGRFHVKEAAKLRELVSGATSVVGLCP